MKSRGYWRIFFLNKVVEISGIKKLQIRNFMRLIKQKSKVAQLFPNHSLSTQYLQQRRYIDQSAPNSVLFVKSMKEAITVMHYNDSKTLFLFRKVSILWRRRRLQRV